MRSSAAIPTKARPARRLDLVLLVLGAQIVPAGCSEPVVDRPVPQRVPYEMGLDPARARRAAETVRHGISTERTPNLPQLGLRLDEVPPSFSRLGQGWSPLPEIAPRVEDARSGGGGEALDAALDELPADRVRQNGIAALTLDQLFGDTFHPGLCEDAELTAPARLGREEWEMRLSVPTFMAFVGDVLPYTSPMPSSCITSLAEAGGDLEAAIADGGCSEFEQHQFFPDDDPTCLPCVEGNGGDFEACVDQGSCPEEAPLTYWVQEEEGEVWYDAAYAYIYGCAPNHTVLTLLLTDIGPDQEPPEAFDHEKWGYLCMPYWEGVGVQWLCNAGDEGPRSGDALLEGMVGRVNGMNPVEDDEVSYFRNLQYYVSSIEAADGVEIKWFWGFSSGAGVFSMPAYEPDSNGNGVYDIEDENYGYGLGGWDLNPYDLRPDGTDPRDPEHTKARDWVAAMSVKFSTTRDGVYISTANHNRCLSWSDEDADGASRCLEMGPPTYGWTNDVQNTWSDSTFSQGYAFPITTLGSTGLPDPDIPGGVAALVAGTPALADPDWDDCTWPVTFVPDLAPMEDTPADYGGPASLWGQTFRFGREDLDLRVILNTNQARDFCPLEDL